MDFFPCVVLAVVGKITLKMNIDKKENFYYVHSNKMENDVSTWHYIFLEPFLT